MSRSRLEVDDALDRHLPLGFFHWRLLVICGLSFIADGMEISLMVFLSSCAEQEWDLSETQAALLSSVVFGGQLIGTFFWGPVADAYGRRLAFIGSASLISIAGLASGLSPSYLYLLLFRSIVGFGLGGSSVPFDLLAEFCPPKERGRFLLYIEYFWSIGSMLVAGSAWLLLPHYSWRLLTIVTAFPVVLTCLVSMYLLPESPRWLCVKNQVEQAEEVLKSAIFVNRKGSKTSKQLLDFSLQVTASGDDAKGHLLDLFSPRLRGVTTPLLVIWACFGAAYYGVLLFTGEVFSSNSEDDAGDDGATCSFDYGSIFVTAAAEFVGCVLIVCFVDSQGRIRTQGVAYSIGAVGCVLMGVLAEAPRQALLWSTLARTGVFAASTVSWVHTPELFPTEVRASGHAVANSSAQIGSFFAPFLIGVGGDGTVGALLGVLSGAAVVCVLLLPETAGRGLDKALRRSEDAQCSPLLAPEEH